MSHSAFPARTGTRTEAVSAFFRPLPWLLAIFAVFYAAQLASFRIPVDAELAALRAGDASAWLPQGRWGIYLVERFLLPQPTVPFLPLACFGLFTAFGYLCFLRAHEVSDVCLRHYALFWVFAAFPVWFLLVEFPANTPSAGLGVALTGLSLLAFARAVSREGRVLGWLAAQAILIALVVSLYQSLVLLVLVAGLGAVTTRALRGRIGVGRMVVEALLLAAAMAAGLVLYYAVWKLALRVAHLEPDYIGSFMRPADLLARPLEVLRGMGWQMRQVYGGGAWTYGVPSYAFAPLALLGLLAVVTTRLPRGGVLLRPALLAFTVAILVAPFSINLVSGGTLPTRTLLAVPAALWFSLFLAVEFGAAWLRWLALACTAAGAAQALYVFALFQAGDAIARQHDEALAASIYARIAEIRPELSFEQRVNLDSFGALRLVTPYPRPAESTIGASTFEWDGGNPYRIASLYRILGYRGIVPVDDARRRELLPVFAAMPVWPAKGSVRAEGDATLVKLGDAPGKVHEELLHGGPRSVPNVFRQEP